VPPPQTNTGGCVIFFTSSSLPGISSKGILMLLPAWPLANSAGRLTSITTLFESLFFDFIVWVGYEQFKMEFIFFVIQYYLFSLKLNFTIRVIAFNIKKTIFAELFSYLADWILFTTKLIKS
jgi:hypothetical protein